jgi:rfaE bifunctional protein nucleotidyltransferase chain/domain
VSSGFDPANKLRTLDELIDIAQDARREGRTVVWTNGCFEILHAGHIEFLMKAARLADVFIVGVNSDASVAALKGAGRPLTALEERTLVLSAVECIDYLAVFDEPTCERILETLRPEVYAKGMHHLHGGIHNGERLIVERSGGCIALIAGDPAMSTENIVAKVRGGG